MSHNCACGHDDDRHDGHRHDPHHEHGRDTHDHGHGHGHECGQGDDPGHEHGHPDQCRNRCCCCCCSCDCHGGHGDDGHGNGGHGGHGGHGDGGHGGPGGGKGDDETTVGWKNPDRPGRTTGTSTGEVPGSTVTPGTFGTKPPNRWPGQRGDLWLPFLFLRANAGDLGARPVLGPFWESPDILLLAGVDPSLAPDRPRELGQTANANQPNTVYAHVWNFGLSSAPSVVVEFYWCDPSLGINAAGAHLIGVGYASLGARGSGRSHAVVKCPTAWYPTFLNGGHECLVVRIWDETSDGIGTPEWDAALNRHIGQRNIHVVAASEHAMARMIGDGAAPLLLPAPMSPLTLKIGPLYGAPATVAVERAAPHQMPWLQLHTGVRGQFPAQAAQTGEVLLGAPRTIGSNGAAGAGAAQHEVHGDDQQVAFTTGDAPPGPGQAHVYRVTASQQGQVFGGYTVVFVG